MSCTHKLHTSAPFIDALMHEITTLLGDFVANGQQAAIDLHGLPLLDEDKQQLRDLLGPGEVSAIVDTLGRTKIFETGYGGVWWISHMGSDGRPDFEQIAITDIPEILRTHAADAKDSWRQLKNRFNPPKREGKF